MKSTLMKFRNVIAKAFSDETTDDYAVPATEEEYVELNTGSNAPGEKIKVRPFVLNDFSGVKPILECLRDGYTIALVNLAPLKEKDIVELKRAINKLKKTTEAISGDIAGFGEEWVIVAPSFVEVYRGTRQAVDAAAAEESPKPRRDVRMDDDADMFDDD